MDLSHITSQSLRRILNLTEQKDRLVSLVTELETEISKVFSGVAVPAAKRPVKKLRKPGKPASKKVSKLPKTSKEKTK